MIETLSKTQTVAEMIIAELATDTQPLTSGDLYERLELDHADTVIHRALAVLLRDGRIELDAPRLGKRGQPAKTYRISPRSDSTRLMTHLEAELAASVEVDRVNIQTRHIIDEEPGPTIRYPLSAILDDPPTAPDPVPTAPRCRACGGLLEYPEHPTCLECQIDTAEHEADAQPPARCAPAAGDPILSALARMDAREPRFQDGAMHVDRIRAMATHLDEGRPILPQMDVIAYLYDLANTIEAMSP